MTKKEYNGWFNYETWLVNLWMGNEEGSSDYYAEMAQERWDNATSTAYATREQVATCDLAEMIKDEYEDSMADLLESKKLQSSVWADLLNASLSEVNWDEIAEHLIENVDKTTDDEDTDTDEDAEPIDADHLAAVLDAEDQHPERFDGMA